MVLQDYKNCGGGGCILTVKRNGVVQAKTQVVISRLGGGAVSMAVKATAGKRRAEASFKFDFFTT